MAEATRTSDGAKGVRSPFVPEARAANDRRGIEIPLEIDQKSAKSTRLLSAAGRAIRASLRAVTSHGESPAVDRCGTRNLVARLLPGTNAGGKSAFARTFINLPRLFECASAVCGTRNAAKSFSPTRLGYP